MHQTMEKGLLSARPCITQAPSKTVWRHETLPFFFKYYEIIYIYFLLLLESNGYAQQRPSTSDSGAWEV